MAYIGFQRILKIDECVLVEIILSQFGPFGVEILAPPLLFTMDVEFLLISFSVGIWLFV